MGLSLWARWFKRFPRVDINLLTHPVKHMRKLPWVGINPRIATGPQPDDLWLFVTVHNPIQPSNHGRTIRVRLTAEARKTLIQDLRLARLMPVDERKRRRRHTIMPIGRDWQPLPPRSKRPTS